MNAEEKIAWLNEHDPLHEWAMGDDVYCLHCDAVFKAEDVACDDVGDPTCPLCISSTPLDFAEIPWWREDLVGQTADEKDVINQWCVEPIHAEAGKPTHLPAGGR
jgi:hypothetical protein